ncbi:fatty-acid-CoA ligase FadD13 domain protein [Mycobacterium ulcerans str. Harvey]|uniref:Fatty-acid-CoA ligase FadD13 domain protein n=1 Tax=Mycobacterium ulcerans str. Harvey TaxID=1299332 RepID=A0ABN0R9Q8_MYCUL|nr:fatty-acid-CoA ligase FadD13 domain protein [Mycobacterium ulcerans str. Harvey]
MFTSRRWTTVIMCAMRGVTLVSMPQFDPASLVADRRRACFAGRRRPAILNFMRLVPEFTELDAPSSVASSPAVRPCPRR